MAPLLLRLPALALRVAGRVLALPIRIMGGGLSRRTWLLFYSGYIAAQLLKAARGALKRRRDPYDGLDGVVSFSSRLIAGEGLGLMRSRDWLRSSEAGAGWSRSLGRPRSGAAESG